MVGVVVGPRLGPRPAWGRGRVVVGVVVGAEIRGGTSVGSRSGLGSESWLGIGVGFTSNQSGFKVSQFHLELTRGECVLT